MFVNCDIGERGIHHPVDLKLMDFIQMANVACGGHAGDKESVDFFCSMAKEKNVELSAHLSYPDRENFGRFSMSITFLELSNSLTQQYQLMNFVKRVKFHGALYNDANVQKDLSLLLVEWMKAYDIEEVVTPFDSLLAKEAKRQGIRVLAEAFAERRYDFNPQTGQLTLTPRTEPQASIKDLTQAVNQAKSLTAGWVEAFIRQEGKVQVEKRPIEVETVCIHSDSEIALELAQALKQC